MKDLKAVKGSFYIAGLIAEGEHDTQDFKFAISDARKIARSLSAFANCRGGRLLVGVKDNGVIAGVRNEEDIYVIEQAAQMYCRPPQQLKFTKFITDGGAVVLRAEIAQSDIRPVRAMESDGKWRAYMRVADENILASPLMVRGWLKHASSAPMSISFSDPERHLLAMIAEFRQVSPEQFMLAAGLSRRKAENTIITLHAMGVIDWTYTRNGWLIMAGTQN